ncbi:MAG TPA: hypothetical protein VGE37_05885 [Archangium sp.]
MTRSLLGLAAVVMVMGATEARADDWGRRGGYHPAAQAQDCGPMPNYAPRGRNFQQGRYELQTTQVWVPGQAQQVWVPGQCQQVGWVQHCTQGYYRTVQTQGSYVTQQQWVWVDYGYRHPSQRNYGRRGGGRFSVSVY